MEENHHKQFKVNEALFVKIEKRFFNFIIDVILLSLLFFVGLVIYTANALPNDSKAFIHHFLTNNLLQYSITSSVSLLYYNFMEITTSRTVGKFFTNTIVVNENGEKASYEAIMFRSLIRIIPLYWISFLFFPTRGLHDVISKTYVVDKWELEKQKRVFYAAEN